MWQAGAVWNVRRSFSFAGLGRLCFGAAVVGWAALQCWVMQAAVWSEAAALRQEPGLGPQLCCSQAFGGNSHVQLSCAACGVVPSKHCFLDLCCFISSNPDCQHRWRLVKHGDHQRACALLSVIGRPTYRMGRCHAYGTPFLPLFLSLLLPPAWSPPTLSLSLLLLPPALCSFQMHGVKPLFLGSPAGPSLVNTHQSCMTCIEHLAAVQLEPSKHESET